IKQMYSENDLHDVYIPQFFSEGSEYVESYIMKWIQKPEEPPIAILAGYGMGKSTLAKRIAYLQAFNYTRNSNERVPILLKLEDLSSEIKLEGLLGAHFTSFSVTHNYNFRLFLKLNEVGKLLIILDGFDEMKKTMSWDSLIYNMSQ